MKMKYQIGDIVEGRITGIQPYGAFVSIDAKTTGLIHISEISDGFVKSISRFVNVGDIVRVKIIDFDPFTKQARLSLKALQKPHARGRRKTNNHHPSLPNGKLGFKTIENNMDEWIEEAKKNILTKN